MKAQITTVVRPGASLEDKVPALEENLNRLRDDSLRELEQLEAAGDSLRADLARLNDERAAVNAQTRTLIEKVETGGLRLERVGLFWLVIGVICASLPDELAGLISWFRN